MTPILSTHNLVLRKGDTPENFDIGRGLTLLNTRRESHSTLLSLALAGRYNPHSGTILLDGEGTKTRQRFKQVALAGVTEIDKLDRLVRIRDVVREQIAWSQSFFAITPHKAEAIKSHDSVEKWLEPLQLEDLDMMAHVGDIGPTDRFRLRVLLALISRPNAKLLIVDDVDQVRKMDIRRKLLDDLRGVAVHLPVMVNTVNEEGL